MLLYRLLKAPFFGRFMVPWKNPLSEEETSHWKKSRLKSRSGGTISVWHQKGNGADPSRTVILGHSMGKPAKGDFLKTRYAQYLLDQGFNVVLFDFNGFGESSLGSFRFHWDLVAVLEMAQRAYPDTTFVYHGVSFGSNWGSAVAHLSDHPFEYMILESSPVNLLEFWKHFPTPYRVLRLLFTLLPHYKTYTNFEQHVARSRGLKAILLITSDSDIYTPEAMAERFREAAPCLATISVYPNARHALAILKDRDRYLKECLEFLTL
ncbi:MAG: alpha/beta fold hydrolase [Bacteroidota bacterium]